MLEFANCSSGVEGGAAGKSGDGGYGKDEEEDACEDGFIIGDMTLFVVVVEVVVVVLFFCVMGSGGEAMAGGERLSYLRHGGRRPYCCW